MKNTMPNGLGHVGQAPTFAELATDAQDCHVHRAWPWHQRLSSAAGRRMLALWRRAGGDRHPLAVEAAVGWLKKQNLRRGLPAREGGPPCCGTTAALLPTLVELGQMNLVRSWCDWLFAQQLPDGSFPRSDASGGSAFNTAQAVTALAVMAAEGEHSHIAALRRAGDYLAGRLMADWIPGTGNMYQVRVAAELCCLPALATAARLLDITDWQDVADRGAAHARRVVDWRLAQASLRLVPYVAEAWLALGEPALAAEAMRGAETLQRRDGAVPATAAGCWGDHALLAHLAALWYRAGERERADRALTRLAKRQLPSGGWHETWGRGERTCESAWVLKHFLDAAQGQVRSAFAAGAPDLPLSIAADDGRFRAVERWMAAFEPDDKITDVGCGSGRFLKMLGQRCPDRRWIGIDFSERLLSRLPAAVEARRGGFLHLPAHDGEFAGAFAVESLEHALLPRQAVAELCRVVRPGGRLLIVDKHVRLQSLSLCQPWERWFSPEDVIGWLAPYCRDITVRAVGHGSNDRAGGLFLCWEARRR